MERLNFFCYNMGHETPWIPRGTGKAPPTCDRVAERRQDDSVGCSAFGGSIKKLRFPMVPRVPRGRVQGPSFKGDSRTSSEAVSKGEKKLAALLLSGPLGAGYRTDLWTLKRIAQTIHKHFASAITPIMCGGCFKGCDGVARNQSGGLTKERERGGAWKLRIKKTN